ncbi:hypothetical protein ACROYT_G024980 [Oculina patagonica]
MNSTSTNYEDKDALDAIAFLQLAVLFLTLVVGFLGNALVVGVVIFNRQMRTRTNIFLTQLAVTGIGVCLFCIPFMIVAIIKQAWVFGEPLCKFNGFVVPFWFASSIFTLTAISIHKYFSIVKPLRKIITQRRTLLIIILVWVSAFACSIGPILGWTRIVYKSSSCMCGPRYPRNALEISHTLFLLSVVYTFPIIAMIFLYWRIINAVKTHCQRIRDTAIIDDRGILAQKKIIITLLFVLAAFVACWTPFFMYGILTLVTDASQLSRHFLRSAYICGFLYSVCNPIILGARNPRFRRGFKELITFQRIRRPSLSPAGAGYSPQSVGDRRPSADYLAEKRCSVWFLSSSQNSLLRLEPAVPHRRRKLRWIETNL